MSLSLQKVDKIVGGEVHLKEIHLEFESNSKNVILGRTLAGKTSLLRIMAGLDRPNRGRIIIGDRDVTGVPVRKRSVAMVYQQFINYPSLTVYKNIAAPLKLKGMNKTDIDARVRDVSRILHLDDLMDRLPSELSGGQQQRTAIARALVKDSELLLLDEPLVNLDYKLREDLREELQAIFQQREAIVVYTTTEPTEALMLGGNIAVMHQGRVLQSGPTPDVYHHPATTMVAEVFSDPPINFLEGTIRDKQALLKNAIAFPLNGHLGLVPEGDYLFGLRANHLFMDKNGRMDVEIKGVVELSEINGSETFIHVNVAGSKLVVQETGIHPHKIGRDVIVYAHPGTFFVYDRGGRLVASPSQADPAGNPH